MNPNNILRRIRYIFDFSDTDMITIFAEAGHEVTRAQVSAWLKKDEDPELEKCTDIELSIFLNGLINQKRGKKDGAQPEPDRQLSNNAILKKLKIAVNFKSEDMIRVLTLGGMRISNHELSAFFRRAGHKHYMECQNQMLRSFLNGLQLELRPETGDETVNPWLK